MRPETAYLLALLRAFIHGEAAPALPKAVDGDALARLARAGNVGGIVGYMTQSLQDGFSEKAAMFLTRQFYATVGQFANTGAACEELFAALRKANIPFAAVKGAVISHLYPMRELRTFGDVDIYVPSAYREAVCAVTAEDTLLFEDSTQIYVKRPPLHVEFHFDPTVDAIESLPQLCSYLADIEQHFSVWQGMETTDPMYHFVYLLSHQLRHFADDSPGIRSFVDLAVFLKSDIAPDPQELCRLLKELGLYTYAQAVLTLTEQWFGVPSPLPKADIDPKDVAFLAEYTVDAGQFARSQNARAAAVEKQGGRMNTLWQSLFPPKEDMKKNKLYAPLASKCLPLAYAYRVYRGIFKRRDYALKAAVDIGTAEKDAAARRRVKQLLGGQDVEKK